MNKMIYKMDLVDSSSAIFNELDYLILASGSDSRAYEILSRCTFEKRAIIFHFLERLNDLDSNSNTDDPLHNYKQYNNSILQEINCNIKDPGSCLTDLLKITYENTSKIGIDISCFTKPYFYFIIKLLKERFSINSIFIFYTEPKSYIFPRGLYSMFKTSSGPISVREMFGYTGQENRGAKRKLIILLGFDGDLSKEINEDVSPIETVVINGFPAYTPKCKDISLIANEKLVNDKNIKMRYTRANNPFDTYNLLQSIKSESEPNTFINIAPLGTKPMALGACLFALHNPDVRIIYPLPESYEKKYSDECWSSWIYDLPLSIEWGNI